MADGLKALSHEGGRDAEDLEQFEELLFCVPLGEVEGGESN